MTGTSRPEFAAVIVAGGRGLRAGGDLPKQYQPLGGPCPLVRSLRAFQHCGDVATIQVAIHPDDRALYDALVDGPKLLPPVAGGATRQASVLAALEVLDRTKPPYVLVHDAVRSFVSAELIARAIAATRASGAAVPALPLTDTIKAIDADGRVESTLPREHLRAVQTPQGFAFAPLLAAHRRAQQEKRSDFSDDAALAEWAGMAVSTFPGDASNIKLTTPEDFAKARLMLQDRLSDIRTGMGFDVHAFAPGDRVMLGGVAIAHERGLSGHSDADVVLHAMVDAILGALAEGDIGTHFPPSDPQWRGASSDRFLKFAVERVAARGGRIAHLDVTLVCEAPRIGPHREAMRQSIARIAGVAPHCVSVKATTSEGLGFTGRREGIAAYATATVRLPGEASDV